MVFFAGMGIKSISLTQESEKILDKLIKENPDFNFSRWIQMQLKNEHDETIVFSSISSIENERSLMIQEIKLLIKKLQMLNYKIQELKEAEEDEKIQAQRFLEREKKVSEEQFRCFNELLRDDIGRDLTIEEYEKYKPLSDNGYITWDKLIEELKNKQTE